MKRTDKEQKRYGKGLERELWMVFSLKRLQNSSDSNESIFFLQNQNIKCKMAEVKLTDKTRKMGKGLVCLSIRLTRFQETMQWQHLFFVFFLVQSVLFIYGIPFCVS